MGYPVGAGLPGAGAAPAAGYGKFTAGGRGLAGENLCRHVASYIPGDPKKLLAKIWQLADTRFAEGVPCKRGLRNC